MGRSNAHDFGWHSNDGITAEYTQNGQVVLSRVRTSGQYHSCGTVTRLTCIAYTRLKDGAVLYKNVLYVTAGRKKTLTILRDT
jgi:hypothetical protein